MRKGKQNVFRDSDSAPYLTQCFFDIIDVLVGAFVCIAIIGAFIFKMVVVSGTSMRDTLYDDDRLLLTNLFYEPKDGDIVVISHTSGISVPIIKRVIATAGQTLNIDFANNKVFVDGQMLHEPYVSSRTIKADAEIPKVIPEGYVFVMGDNRSNSQDSRYKSVGLVSTDNILGKASFIVFPFDRFGSPYSNMK